ncbi:MADS-box transcription factor [Quillaja saponaria]|uniref:MADS-box transcription factor n=1 Tax=Quillaja saponaria TaxID=32244 RepID=A0AAD7LGL5_QUISA|nr:MADS-box transcription factor [Quillaja saponaria]
MARGKIQIKKIENPTNRQVTYSKRRNGLFKKANELSVLCDAKVSIIMFNSNDKLHEYISPSTTRKQLYDQYQKAMAIDLWSAHYEKMQETLIRQKEVSRNLRREIRRRLGECLDDLCLKDLRDLEDEMENTVTNVRVRKYKLITNQIDTCKKKVKSAEQQQRYLLQEFDARADDPHYGVVDNGGEYDSVIGYSNGGPHIFALGLPPNHPNLHSGAGSDLTTYPLLD